MKKILLLLLVVTVAMSATSTAALQTIGTATYGGSNYKLIYDTDDQLTWLDYSRPGVDYYQGSADWAASLNNPGALTVNLDPGYTALWGSSQWQLPQVNVTIYYSGNVYDWPDSAIYDLYYNELGNIQDDPSINTGPFDNLQLAWYWLEPSIDTGPTYKPAFNLGTGRPHQGYYGMVTSVNGGIYAMATIPGAVVPEPATLGLLGLGAVLLRRKK